MVHKMSRELRAKQFMPFAALKGYEEALRKKEKMIAAVPKIQFAPERAEELDRILRGIKKGDVVTATYFCQGQYVTVTGIVKRLHQTERWMEIGEERISMEELYEISPLALQA